MSPAVTDLARRYFELAGAPDREAYLAQFADDAVVEDDGGVHHGLDEIRAWRSGTPDVAYDLAGVTEQDGHVVATAQISGDFPGSPVTLTFHFLEADATTIRHLAIRA